MSQDTLELVQRAYAFWNRDDIESALSLFSPDSEVQLSGVFADLPTLYRGHEGFREFWRNLREVWEEFTAEPVEVVEVDDERVLVKAHFRGRGREGIAVDRLFGHLWTVRDGMVVRLRSYPSWEEAMEAAGVREG